MKIAVCLSGQLRQWELAHRNQRWFWETFGADEVDYFLHTWNYSGDRAGVQQEYEWRDVNKWEFNRICKAYNVKDSIFDKKPQSWFYDNDHWSALFYGLSQSLMLKRKHEIENNFEYDLVIKSRPDIVFYPGKTCYLETLDCDDNVIITTHGGNMGHEFGMFNIDDCVFYGNSKAMDTIVNMYFYRQKLIDSRHKDKEKLCIQQLGPGVLMHEYFREYGITPIVTARHRDSWQPTLLKLGCPTDLDLFQPDEFKKIESYFREFYTK